MYNLIFSFILGGGDSEGWENLLFLVVIAVIWGIGGIIKSRAEVAQREKQRELGRRQTRPRQTTSGNKNEIKKSDELLEKALRFKEALTARQNGRADTRQAQIHRPPRPSPKTVVQARTIEKRTEKVPPHPVISEQKQSVDIDGLSKIDPKIQDLPDFIPEKINKIQTKKVSKENIHDLHGSFPFESLFAYGDSDELKRAILYSEILGKPLSIRESTGFYS